MSEGLGQHYCGNCGTEIRSGTSFCVSCGTPASGGPASPGPDNPVPPPTPSRSLANTLKQTFRGLTVRFSNARSASSGASLRELPNRAINWFKDLPSVPKLMIVGLLLLLLLTVLSPIARVIAIVAFVVSAVALAVRAIQRRPIKGWGIAAVTSFVLVFVFGSISSVIYGSGFTSFVGADRDSGDLSEIGDPEEEYLRAKDVIRDAQFLIGEQQRDIYDICIDSCSQNNREVARLNSQDFDDLLERVRDLDPPEGYEESHSAFLSGSEIETRQMSLMAADASDGIVGDADIDGMTEESNALFEQAYQLLPPSGRSYWDLNFRFD